MPHIESVGLDDERLAPYRALRDADLLRTRGIFVAEGRLVLERVLEDRPRAIRSIMVNAASLRALGDRIESLSSDASVFVCDAPAFHAVTGFNLHRGCLALVDRPAALDPDDLIREAGTVVVLEGVTDADNVGGVFRNAAAFDARAVLLSPTCCDPLYRKAVRTSMAATLRVPFARLSDWPGDLGRLRAAGFCLVALTPRAPSITLEALALKPRPARLALVVGTEGAGLSLDAECAADVRVRIPTTNRVDSLNLAVATGIVLSRLSGGGPL